MTSRLINFENDKLTLRADTPKTIGSNLDLEVRLPRGILIKSFLLNGIITGCDQVTNNGSSCYELEMKIGDISPMNQKILDAYKDFLQREKAIKDVKVDLVAFQEAFEVFGSRLKQLRKTAEEVKANVRGTLELMRMKSGGKTTLH